MPIKPENRARYPKDWPLVRARILERAGYQCEHPGCGARQYAVGTWELVAGLWRWLPEQGNGPCDAAGQGLSWPDLQSWSYAQARQFAADLDWAEILGESPKPIVIVLTVAHLDHQPENCDDENLRAMCQRHHLAHDAEHHKANTQATRRARKAVGDLFEIHIDL